eukprot:CAMPEP_0184556714 /NCGR_PEP_ID=MMETSP0199_2-20130426/40962_1 /TAXON_ID=1112570 /ORGANISM="Thraustochytrium sp., Strain LLF1b" /LENGTH=451 /DNA_ID=CAMNT_0026953431 /DNA_START=387 /DNA_END=1742 /DNA_ORIENTATION=-
MDHQARCDLARNVGVSFLKQYYRVLVDEKRANLDFFYADNSTLCVNSGSLCQGGKSIKAAYDKLSFTEVDVNHAAFLPTHENGILVVAAGKFTTRSGVVRAASQTFVLVPTADTQPVRYHVLSDLLAVTDGKPFSTEAATETPSPEAASAAPAPVEAAATPNGTVKPAPAKSTKSTKKAPAANAAGKPSTEENNNKPNNRAAAAAPAAAASAPAAKPTKTTPAAPSSPVAASKEEVAPVAAPVAEEPAGKTGFSYASAAAKAAQVPARAAPAPAPDAAAPAAPAQPAAASGTATRGARRQDSSNTESGNQAAQPRFEPGCALFVKDLTKGTTEAQLRESFSSFGTVRSVELPQGGKTFAFVNFTSPDAVKAAIAAPQITVANQAVVVQERTSTPPSSRRNRGPGRGGNAREGGRGQGGPQSGAKNPRRGGGGPSGGQRQPRGPKPAGKAQA